jgi:hypothetical protein
MNPAQDTSAYSTWFIDESIAAGEVIPDSIRAKASMENATASRAHFASGSSRRRAAMIPATVASPAPTVLSTLTSGGRAMRRAVLVSSIHFNKCFSSVPNPPYLRAMQI